MYRPAARALLRQSVRTARPLASRRLISSAPEKPRSWKNSAARWAIAIGGIYWYNTSTIFADEPSFAVQDGSAEEELPTLASLAPSSRFQPPTPEEKPSIPVTPSSSSPPSLDPKAPSPTVEAPAAGSPAELEQEAQSQGAFNEETGEINWDCPCLGGMAYGPCGEEFRAAFSCFVFSKEEPKGMDCIDKFKGMQTCFRAHPDIYGAELEDEDDEASLEASGLPEDAPAVAAVEAISLDQKAAPETDSASTSVIATELEKAKASEAAPVAEKRSIYDEEKVPSPSESKVEK